MKLAITYTNFGPYHLARLRALASAIGRQGGRLVAYEVAGTENRYPWQAASENEPFEWTTFFPDSALEDLSRPLCVRAMLDALDRDLPDVVAIVGYARPESMAALRWAERMSRPTVLMSESQEVDHPRTWWKEAVKARRVRRFDAALVGGASHRDYLERLGMPGDRIALGYNAVDNAFYRDASIRARALPEGREGLPGRPYFLSVSRFVPEKNLQRLVRSFSAYRAQVDAGEAWDLVLCGDGPFADSIRKTIAREGMSDFVHLPGFLQAKGLARWYAFAGAFVHPSLMEPWGLVVNEAAACGLPLLVSDNAGCARTLVPDPVGTTGWRFDPRDENAITASLVQMTKLDSVARIMMGRRASEVIESWGPERFASGTLDAIEKAHKQFAQLRRQSERKPVGIR